jgi:hypothetical protein
MHETIEEIVFIFKINVAPAMKPTDEQYELIDQYLQGELSGEELAEMESLIANDPEFAEAVQSERIIIAAIKQAAREEMKMKMNETFKLGRVSDSIKFQITPQMLLESSHSNSAKELKVKPEKSKPSYSWILVAASVLLFAGIGIYFLIEKNYTSHSPKEMVFNLPIKTIGVRDTALGYIVPDDVGTETSTIPIRLIEDKKQTKYYRLTDTLTLLGTFSTDANAFELIRLNEKDISQLYLKMDNQFYPLSKTEYLANYSKDFQRESKQYMKEESKNTKLLISPSEIAPLKAEVDERVIERLKILIKSVEKDAEK